MSRARPTGCIAAAFLALGVLLSSREAGATPNFPPTIKSRLGAQAEPECAICHVCGVTGRGTVNTPWGAAMRARGLQAYDVGSLATALQAMERDGVDSDGDGKIDVEAVKEGLDPNPPNCVAGEDPTVAQYGCLSRVAPRTTTPDASLVLLFGLVALAFVFRRRAGGALTGALLLGVGGAALLACQSGAALAPRTELFERKRSAAPPKMAPIAATTFAGELVSLGLDPLHLPPFEALAPRQLRGVMSTFTRSLGFACTDCHAATNQRLRTHAMTVSIHMWNEMTRPYALADGGALYCDSCHQGQGKLLNRSDRDEVAIYMAENYTGALRRVDDTRTSATCEACHGKPMDTVILAKWLR